MTIGGKEKLSLIVLKQSCPLVSETTATACAEEAGPGELDGHAQPEAPLSESLLRRVDVEDDDSDCNHPTGDNRASGNEDLGSDSDSDSEVEMADAEDLDLEEAVFDNAFEMLLKGSQQPGLF